MKVLKLKFKNFRNIENIEIIPEKEMNVIFGENAQGKTNILEGIWLFTGAKSFRGAKDNEYINFNSGKKAELELTFLAEGIEKEAKIEIEEKRTSFLNGKKLKFASSLAGNFNAIVFSPNDLRLISDGPSQRRRFLDTAIGQLYPQYIEILRNYSRAVTQRNKLIKDFKYDSTVSVMLDSFEEEIAQSGEKIILYRKKYIDLLNLFLPAVYDGLSDGREKLETTYISSFEGNFLEELKKRRKEDMFSATTSIGPHRDDIDFKINGYYARSFGSQGQKRSIALSLKLAEAEVINKNVGEWPIFILDDVMSELDPKRQNFILNKIEGMQVFLTCCEPSNVKNLNKGKIFNVKEGCIL